MTCEKCEALEKIITALRHELYVATAKFNLQTLGDKPEVVPDPDWERIRELLVGQ